MHVGGTFSPGVFSNIKAKLQKQVKERCFFFFVCFLALKLQWAKQFLSYRSKQYFVCFDP